MEQETIENRTNYECDICESVFKRVNKLKVHYIFFHRGKKFKCDKCDKLFPFKSLLKYHLPTCTGIDTCIKKKRVKNQWIYDFKKRNRLTLLNERSNCATNSVSNCKNPACIHRTLKYFFLQKNEKYKNTFFYYVIAFAVFWLPTLFFPQLNCIFFLF